MELEYVRMSKIEITELEYEFSQSITKAAKSAGMTKRDWMIRVLGDGVKERKYARKWAERKMPEEAPLREWCLEHGKFMDMVEGVWVCSEPHEDGL